MLGHDARRSGATTVELRPPFVRKWFRAFPDEGIMAGVQPIVAGGTVFVGTLHGKLHAIDAATGEDRWVIDLGSPILHSPAADDERIFVGAADGKIRAFRLSDGAAVWEFRTGAAVWNSPAVHDGQVYVGSRDGRFYVLSAVYGRMRNSVETGGPILCSPAVDPDRRRVVVGSEDMHVYAFDLATGAFLWRSSKLPGASLRGYHPVVAPDGSVMIAAMPAAGGDAIQQLLLDMTKEVFGDFASWRHDKETNDRLRRENFALMEKPGTYQKQLEYLRKRLTDEPAYQTFFLLDGATGKPKAVVPLVYAESMNGPGSPAVVTPKGEVLVKYCALLRSRYEHYSPFLNVGRLNTQTGDIAPLLDESRTYGWHDSLLLVHDEQSQLSVGGRVLFNAHQADVNALDLDTLKGYPSPFARNQHEPEAGVALGIWSNWLDKKTIPPGYEWFARGTAVYGGGSAIDVPVAIAGDSFYFLPTHELSAGCCVVAYRTAPDGKEPPAPAAPKQPPTDLQWQRVLQQEQWDWDTLAADRLSKLVQPFPSPVPGAAQNPMWDEAKAKVAAITDAQLNEIIWRPESRERKRDADAERSTKALREELQRAVEELIAKQWRPLLFPAGKAPAEAARCFVDPTETLYTYALAAPHLTDPNTRIRLDIDAAVRLASEAQLDKRYDAAAGEIRSLYDPPPESLVRVVDDTPWTPLGRLYVRWLWAESSTGGWRQLRQDWPTLRHHIDPAPLPNKSDCGNLRVAGLIAACRIAKQFNDDQTLAALLPAARQAMRDRLIYEHAYPAGGLITREGNRSHFGRWRHLTPDVARLLSLHAADVTRRLMDVYVDHHRPTWWLAWNVELLWRNETPLSLPTMSRDVFAARAMILHEPLERLAAFIDRPWCKADEFYIQKLAMLLDQAER